MIKTGLLFFGCVIAFEAGAKEIPFTQEDRERLIRLEAVMSEFKDSVDKRFEQMDKRFEEFRNYMDKRFEQLITFLWILSAIFVGIVAVTIAFALWDRRTIIKPFEEKLTRFISVLKELAKTDEKLAEALRKFGFL